MNRKEKWGLAIFIFGINGVSYNSLIGENIFMYLSMIPVIIGLKMFITSKSKKEN